MASGITIPRKTCPLCQGKGRQLILKQNDYFLYECRRCRFIYVDPIHKNIEFIYDEKYYNQEMLDVATVGYIGYENDRTNLKREFGRYLKKILTYNMTFGHSLLI